MNEKLTKNAEAQLTLLESELNVPRHVIIDSAIGSFYDRFIEEQRGFLTYFFKPDYYGHINVRVGGRIGESLREWSDRVRCTTTNTQK